MTAAGASVPPVEVRDLTMAYGDAVIQRDLTFTVGRGEIFVVMGDSGSGKSTLMRHMIGLKRPAHGDVLYEGEAFWAADDDAARIAEGPLRRPLSGGRALELDDAGRERLPAPGREAGLSPEDAAAVARLKLALVGLAGFGDHYPAEISGGMRKRAGLARALALDPPILYLDEPSAGLDPLTSRRLDDLILEQRDSAGTTVVLVTHELASIFALGDNAVFLDGERKTLIAQGNTARAAGERGTRRSAPSSAGAGCECPHAPARGGRLHPGRAGHHPRRHRRPELRSVVRPAGPLRTCTSPDR